LTIKHIGRIITNLL